VENEMSDAKVIYSSVLPAGIVPTRTPRVAFYADTDDHLRAPALLTLQLRERYPALGEVGASCLDPNASWHQRLDGLQELLEESSKLRRSAGDKSPLLLLENIEALDEQSPAPINDDDEAIPRRISFGYERRQLRRMLLSAVDWRGIWVQTGAALSEELELLPSEAYNRHERWLERLLIDVPLAVRDLVQRLLELGEEDRVGVELIVEAGAGDLTEHLLWETYTTLPAPARDAARQIAALREAQPYNGVLGDLTVEAKTIQAEAKVSRGAVEQLIKRGWLVPVAPSKLMMPWLLRSYALKQASMWTADEQQTTWETLVVASKAVDKPDAAAQMELHHRAIEARDIETAWASARYYTGDMVALARQLSAAHKYLEAARIYREITRRSPDDAYAWEYLAFNLACTDDQALHAEEITRGYERAHTLARRPNSLYWARWLCWRIEQHMISLKDAGGEFDKALQSLEPLPQRDRFARFARPVRKTLERMGYKDLYHEWTRGWEQRIGFDPEP
jgi:hypothetical protein